LVAIALPLAGLPFFAGVAAPAALVAGAGASAALSASVGVAPSGASSLSTPMASMPARVIAAPAAAVLDQALRLEAAEHLVDGAAPDLERLGQRQHGTVVALRGGAQDHDLAITQRGHGMISVCREHDRPPTAPSPGGRTRSGQAREIRPATRRARPR
jgi:hypothetical protein